MDDEHNLYGSPLLASSRPRVTAMRSRLKGESVRLGTAARDVVKRTIEAHCGIRGWNLAALNVRSNHVHVVVHFGELAPEKMMGEWKAWSTRRLREARLMTPEQPVWTDHGSTRYLWTEPSLQAAVRYVLEGQDPRRFGDRGAV